MYANTHGSAMCGNIIVILCFHDANLLTLQPEWAILWRCYQYESCYA